MGRGDDAQLNDAGLVKGNHVQAAFGRRAAGVKEAHFVGESDWVFGRGDEGHQPVARLNLPPAGQQALGVGHLWPRRVGHQQRTVALPFRQAIDPCPLNWLACLIDDPDLRALDAEREGRRRRRRSLEGTGHAIDVTVDACRLHIARRWRRVDNQADGDVVGAAEEVAAERVPVENVLGARSAGSQIGGHGVGRGPARPPVVAAVQRKEHLQPADGDAAGIDQAVGDGDGVAADDLRRGIEIGRGGDVGVADAQQGHSLGRQTAGGAMERIQIDLVAAAGRVAVTAGATIGKGQVQVAVLIHVAPGDIL